MESLITTLVGLFGGLLLSIAFWYFMAHVIVPSLVFSEAISRLVHSETGKTIYRVKVRNHRRRRGVIDISIEARIHYRGLLLIPRDDDVQPSNALMLDVPLDNPHLFRLGPGGGRVIWLDLDRIAFGNFPFTSELKNMAKSGEGDVLESLLGVGNDAYLTIHVLCYDEWTSARRYYSSRQYRKDDVKAGRFTGMDVR